MCEASRLYLRVCWCTSRPEEHVGAHCEDHEELAVTGSTDKAYGRVHLTSSCSPFNPPPPTPHPPNIRFLQYSLSLYPPPAPPSRPLPHPVYIITLLWSAAAPHCHCHGNSGTTAGWLPLLPGGVASQPHFAPLLSLAEVSGGPAETMNQERNVHLDELISRLNTNAPQCVATGLLYFQHDNAAIHHLQLPG